MPTVTVRVRVSTPPACWSHLLRHSPGVKAHVLSTRPSEKGFLETVHFEGSAWNEVVSRLRYALTVSAVDVLEPLREGVLARLTIRECPLLRVTGQAKASACHPFEVEAGWDVLSLGAESTVVPRLVRTLRAEGLVVNVLETAASAAPRSDPIA